MFAFIGGIDRAYGHQGVKLSTKNQVILQITDLHLFADPEQRLLGVNTDDSFNAVVDLALRQHPDPEAILLTGDLSQDETVQAYERIAEKLKDFHCPKYWIPGNHDDTHYIDQVFSQHRILPQRHIIFDKWQFILLDSKKLNAVEGQLDSDQFELIRNSLGEYPQHHTMIFLHHHPLPVGSRWLDNLMLTNADEFWETIEPFHHIKAVICGHVHQEHEAKRGDIMFYSTPSTCFQFKRNSTPFGVEPLMPGYRSIELRSDGTFESQVHRVVDFKLDLDERGKGY